MRKLEEVKQLRNRLGMTQTDLAKKCDISQSVIAKIESKRTVPSYNIACKIFGVLDRELLRVEKSKGVRTASELCTGDVISVDKTDKVKMAIKLMREHEISQMPVTERGRVVGSITEKSILSKIELAKENERVATFMEVAFPSVPPDAPLSIFIRLLDHYQAVLVRDEGEIFGIISRQDIFKVI
jgi:predicted transcriptional regulator